MKADSLDLGSGRWHSTVVTTPESTLLELTHAANPRNRMRVRLPADWRRMELHEIHRCACCPEVRLWEDEDGIMWRVSAVGPNTDFPYPLRSRYLVFDSESAWAGIVRFEEGRELGNLSDLEMRDLRDGIADFGGRRRAYRAPTASR